MARFVVGLIIGGVLVMGIASGQGGSGGTPSPTYPPGTWVDAPVEAKAGTLLANRGYCRRGTEIRQVHNIIDNDWRTTHYRCRPNG